MSCVDYCNRRVDTVTRSSQKSARFAAIIVKIFTRLAAAVYRNSLGSISIASDSPNRPDRRAATRNQIVSKSCRHERCRIDCVMGSPIAQICPMSSSVRIVRWIAFIVAVAGHAFRNRPAATGKTIAPRDWMRRTAVSVWLQTKIR